MAITQDGEQKFGISETTLKTLVVESFSISKTSNRIDINDGNGEPSGAVIATGRTEVTATVQLGATGTPPSIGEKLTLASGYQTSDESSKMVITSVEKTETAADYQRFNLGGYLEINDAS